MKNKFAIVLATFCLFSCKDRGESSLYQASFTAKKIEIPNISYSYEIMDKVSGNFVSTTITNNTNTSALSIDKLRKLVKDRDIGSVDELLQSFDKNPEFGKLLSQFVLIFNSNSEEASAVAPSIPRVVLHADLLFISFTALFKDAEQKIPNSYQETLPLFYFDPIRKTFTPGLFTFRQGKAVFEDNPKSCSSCHGDPAVPIWAPYSVWPGAYGMMDNQIYKITERALRDVSNLVVEAKNFSHFFTMRSKTDRYRSLKFPDPVVTNHLNSPFDEQEGVFKGRLTGAPNTLLTHHIYHLNYWRILNEILSSDHYNQYRYAIWGALLDCDNIQQFFPFTLPIEPRVKVREFATSHVDYLNHTESLINDIGGADTAIEISYSIELASKHIPKLFGNLAYVLQKTDLDPYTWSLAKYPGYEGRSFIFNAGADNESDGSSLLLHEFLKKKLITEVNPDCKDIARKSRELF